MNRDVIPFEYATIGRAAKFFGCEVDDFFHWNEIGLIKLALSFDDFNGTLLSIKDKRYELPPEFNGEYLDFRDEDYRDALSSFVCEHLRLDPISNICRVHGVASGMWIPCPVVIEHLRKYENFRSSFWASPYNSAQEYRAMIDVKKIERTYVYEHIEASGDYAPEIRSCDLILYKDDLTIIRQLLTTGITDRNVGQQTNKPEVKRQEHSTQFAVICQLLKMNGLSDDEIYTGSTTRLQRTLEQKASTMKITFPSIDKNTWARWRARFPNK